MSKYVFQAGSDEIYWDSATEELIMVGELGEERIPLGHKFTGLSQDECNTIVYANFLYCVDQYCGMQFSDSSNMSEPVIEVELDSPGTEMAEPELMPVANRKREDLN